MSTELSSNENETEKLTTHTPSNNILNTNEKLNKQDVKHKRANRLVI